MNFKYGPYKETIYIFLSKVVLISKTLIRFEKFVEDFHISITKSGLVKLFNDKPVN